MKHYGDITKINGTVVPPVDIITGGSPCQDLSVAGKRAGLAGERSGLFIEQIRIVKEMRNESKRRLSISGTNYDFRCVKPRYMVWENVKGAFSSGTPKGADFAIVLEEIVKIVCKECPPLPIPKNGWPHAGCIEGMGDDGCPFSICWRLHDACMWGVPQRRKRIALVADFGGSSAPEILFERKGMSGNNQEVREQRETITPDAQNGIRTTNYTVKVRGGREIDSNGRQAGKGLLIQTEKSATLGVSQDQTLFQNIPNVMVLENHPQDSRMKIKEDGIFQTMGARQGAETDPHTLMILEPQVYDASRRHDYQPFDDVCETVQAHYGTGGGNCPIVIEGNGQRSSHQGDGYKQSEIMYTLNTVEKHAVANGMVVRRLTPLECERLQGFPDEWTNIGEWVDSKGKKHKEADAPRFKSLGNSIALPFWEWMAERMVEQLDVKNPTMASLFDGIGGFPLVYSRCGCKPVWASEIEEFPIAVTKYHFGNE